MIILNIINSKFTEFVFHQNFFIFSKYKNSILDDNYNGYHYEYKKFKNSYIKYCYKSNKLYNIIYYNYIGGMHNEYGPASIFYFKSGEICYKLYYLNNKNYFYDEYLLEVKKLV